MQMDDNHNSEMHGTNNSPLRPGPDPEYLPSSDNWSGKPYGNIFQERVDWSLAKALTHAKIDEMQDSAAFVLAQRHFDIKNPGAFTLETVLGLPDRRYKIHNPHMLYQKAKKLMSPENREAIRYDTRYDNFAFEIAVWNLLRPDTSGKYRMPTTDEAYRHLVDGARERDLNPEIVKSPYFTRRVELIRNHFSYDRLVARSERIKKERERSAEIRLPEQSFNLPDTDYENILLDAFSALGKGDKDTAHGILAILENTHLRGFSADMQITLGLGIRQLRERLKQ